MVGVCERYDARQARYAVRLLHHPWHPMTWPLMTWQARYAVRLPSQPKPLALKGDNLELADPDDGKEAVAGGEDAVAGGKDEV